MGHVSVSIVALLAWCGVAAAESRVPDIWIPLAELRAGWEVILEAPSDPAHDSDLVGWGVRALETRHYTRYRGRLSEVCSVEVWEFTGERAAKAASAGFAAPNWVITREGLLLIMLRGRTWERGFEPKPGVFDACRRIGERVRERAVRLGGDRGDGARRSRTHSAIEPRIVGSPAA